MLNLQELSEKGILFDGHFKLLRPLSTDGATADVWLAIDTNTIDTELDEESEERKEETGMRVAIKVYRPKNALDIEGEQRFRDEYKIVYECRHANLLQPTGFSICGEYPYLVLPYCQNGSSEKLIGQKLSEADIWKYVLDVASGLNRLHTNNPQIVHQDIKPANILIDNTGNYAITDFGISSRRGGVHGYYDEDNSGTMAYMAPERFAEDAEPMPQSDIWGFGATLFEILTGKVPFGEDGGKSQQPGDPMPAMSGIPASIQRLVFACLDYEPGNRPTAQNLMMAARAKQFPIRDRKKLWVSLTVMIALVFGFGIWKLIVSNPVTIEPKPEPPEKMYNQALAMMESSDTTIFMEGYRIMDSLSKMEYIPAMYEIVITHGWYITPTSIHRKDMKGIKYAQNDNYRPINDEDERKAMSTIDIILEKGDSQYDSINADIAFRMAGYYMNSTNEAKRNPQKGIEYLNIAQKWAETAKDSSLNSMAIKIANAKNELYKKYPELLKHNKQ